MRLSTLYVSVLAALASAAVIDVKVAVDDNNAPSISALPDGCYWSGTAPTCEGECNIGEVYCGKNGCGDGKCCASGWKVLCCRNCMACPNALASAALERVMAGAHHAQHLEM